MMRGIARFVVAPSEVGGVLVPTFIVVRCVVHQPRYFVVMKAPLPFVG